MNEVVWIILFESAHGVEEYWFKPFSSVFDVSLIDDVVNYVDYLDSLLSHADSLVFECVEDEQVVLIIKKSIKSYNWHLQTKSFDD